MLARCAESPHPANCPRHSADGFELLSLTQEEHAALDPGIGISSPDGAERGRRANVPPHGGVTDQDPSRARNHEKSRRNYVLPRPLVVL
jgi:hypothetical protein